MAKSSPNTDVTAFLDRCPRKVQQLMTTMRRLIRKTVPDVSEAVYAGWNLIGYRVAEGAKSHFFCFLTPGPDHIRVGFEYGALLADPRHLLSGRGKRVRHVVISKSSDIDPEHLGMLIAEAALVAVNHGHALV